MFIAELVSYNDFIKLLLLIKNNLRFGMISLNALSKRLSGLLLIILILPSFVSAQNGKLTFEDVMKWEDISDTEISDNGNWLIYSVWPDRGDGEARVMGIENEKQFAIERGDNPAITDNGRWVGAYIKPPLKEELQAKNDKKPMQGFGLLNTENGETTVIDSVKSFVFSNDSKWLAVHFYQSEEVEKKKSKNKKLGTALLLKNLEANSELRIPFVNEMSFDSTSTYLAYSVVDTSGTENGIYRIDLSGNTLSPEPIHNIENGLYQNLNWNGKKRQLAFTAAEWTPLLKPVRLIFIYGIRLTIHWIRL